MLLDFLNSCVLLPMFYSLLLVCLCFLHSGYFLMFSYDFGTCTVSQKSYIRGCVIRNDIMFAVSHFGSGN